MSYRLPEGHQGRREAFALITITIITEIFLSIPQKLAVDGKSAAWIIILIAGALSFVGLYFILALSRRFPGKTIVEAGEEAGGPFLGTIAALAYFIFFMASLILFLRQFSETIITAFLPQTPISVITAGFLVVIIYSTYIGLEAISRTAGLLIGFIIGSLALITVLLIPFMVASYNLFPFWGSGPDIVARLGATRTSLFGEILIVGLIAPLLSGKELGRVGITSLAAAIGIMTFVEVIYLIIFPLPASAVFTFPLYSGARLVFIGRFVQRIDAIFVFVWIITALIKLAATMYASAAVLARALKLPVFRPLVFPLGILVFAISFTIPSFPDAVTIDSRYLRTYGWIPAFLFPALVYLVAVLRKKGGRGSDLAQSNS